MRCGRFGWAALAGGLLLGTAAAGISAAPARAVRSAAVVAGPITIDLSNGSVTAPLFAPSGFSGQAVGTVDALGNVTIPQGGITLPSIGFTLILPVTLEPSAAADWSGTIDQVTGAMTLHAPINLRIPVIPIIGGDCSLGPIDFNLSSSNAGGVPLDFGTGLAHLTDGNFAIPNLAVSATCSAAVVAAAGTIAGLPVTAGTATSSFDVAVTFAPPPPPPPTLNLSKTTVAPGEGLNVSGTGFAPGSTVSITLESVAVTLGSANADGAGDFTLDVTIPGDTPPGAHTIKATGVDPGDGPLVLSADLTVATPVAATTPPTTAPAATLPATGACPSTVPLGLAATGLVLAGLALLLVERRLRILQSR